MPSIELQSMCVSSCKGWKWFMELWVPINRQPRSFGCTSLMFYAWWTQYFSTGSRPNGKRWQDFPEAPTHHRRRTEIELCVWAGILSYFCGSACICTCQTNRPVSQTGRTCVAAEASVFSVCAMRPAVWSGHLDTVILMLSWTSKEVWCANCRPWKWSGLRQDEKQTVHQGHQNRLMLSPEQYAVTHTLQNVLSRAIIGKQRQPQ